MAPDEELRQRYLFLVNSDEWSSSKARNAEEIKQELDRRGVPIYPEEEKK